MYVSPTSSQSPQRPALGASHGYRIDHDWVSLHAELDGAGLAPGRNWSLELWACPAAYQGGKLEGVRVAALDLAVLNGASNSGQRWVEGSTQGAVPAGDRDYAMVLALVADGEEVIDSADYARRERFAGLELSGELGYSIEGGEVVLRADCIANAREAENLSGSLVLELRAHPASGPIRMAEGEVLARAQLFQVAGQCESQPVSVRVAFAQPTLESARLSLVLCEWAGAAGYVARDWSTFPALHRAVSAPAAPAASAHGERLAEVISLHDRKAQVAAAPLSAPAPSSPPASAAPVPTPTPSSAATSSPVATPSPAATPSSAATSSPSPAVAPPASPREPRPAAPAASAPAPTSARTETAAPAPAQAEKTEAKAPPASSERSERVSISRGSIDELAQVKGLNRKLAHAIVKGRPFSTLDELVKVRGIGPKILKTLKERLEL